MYFRSSFCNVHLLSRDMQTKPRAALQPSVSLVCEPLSLSTKGKLTILLKYLKWNLLSHILMPTGLPPHSFLNLTSAHLWHAWTRQQGEGGNGLPADVKSLSQVPPVSNWPSGTSLTDACFRRSRISYGVCTMPYTNMVLRVHIPSSIPTLYRYTGIYLKVRQRLTSSIRLYMSTHYARRIQVNACTKWPTKKSQLATRRSPRCCHKSRQLESTSLDHCGGVCTFDNTCHKPK